MMAGLAADDGAAVRFVDGEIKEAISSRANAQAFRVRFNGTQVIEEPIPTRYLGGFVTLEL